MIPNLDPEMAHQRGVRSHCCTGCQSCTFHNCCECEYTNPCKMCPIAGWKSDRYMSGKCM